jgi:hypothetical protein
MIQQVSDRLRSRDRRSTLLFNRYIRAYLTGDKETERRADWQLKRISARQKKDTRLLYRLLGLELED